MLFWIKKSKEIITVIAIIVRFRLHQWRHSDLFMPAFSPSCKLQQDHQLDQVNIEVDEAPAAAPPATASFGGTISKLFPVKKTLGSLMMSSANAMVRCGRVGFSISSDVTWAGVDRDFSWGCGEKN